MQARYMLMDIHPILKRLTDIFAVSLFVLDFLRTQEFMTKSTYLYITYLLICE